MLKWHSWLLLLRDPWATLVTAGVIAPLLARPRRSSALVPSRCRAFTRKQRQQRPGNSFGLRQWGQSGVVGAGCWVAHPGSGPPARAAAAVVERLKPIEKCGLDLWLEGLRVVPAGLRGEVREGWSTLQHIWARRSAISYPRRSVLLDARVPRSDRGAGPGCVARRTGNVVPSRRETHSRLSANTSQDRPMHRRRSAAFSLVRTIVPMPQRPGGYGK